MANRANTTVKIVLLTWALFTPYYLWLFRSLLLNKMPPYPWPAVIGLTYIPLAVVFVVLVAKRMYRKELAGSQASSPRGQTSATLTLDTVWISSVDYLKRFHALPWYAKWFGLLPEGFPRVRAGLFSSPLVYFAQGILNLSADRFEFSARFPTPTATKSYANLESDLRLSFAPNQVLSVRRFDMRQVAPVAIALPFIRIQAASGELQDFLVCAGSRDVSAIARETDNLFFALSAFVSKAKKNDSESRVSAG
jgi:hypothetical protein